MRNYWLRIALGALAVFTIGMILITVVRRGKRSVEQFVSGSGPITIPVPFIPFRLDGERVGTLRQVSVLRSAPDQVTGIEIVVRPSDTMTATRLNDCLVVAETVSGFDPMTGFRCATLADTAGRDLVPFGTVRLEGDTTRHEVLVDQSVVADLQSAGSGDSSRVRPPREMRRSPDSVTRATDSLMRMSDSIRAAVMRSIDSARAPTP